MSLASIAPNINKFASQLSPSINNDLVSIHNTAANATAFHFQPANNISIAIVVKVTDEGTILQCAKAIKRGAKCLLLPYSLRMGASLNRASYGQLTEGEPSKLPCSHNRLHKIDPDTLSVYNPHLGAQLVTSLEIHGQPLDFHNVTDQEAFNFSLDTTVDGRVDVPPSETAIFSTRLRILSSIDHHTDVSNRGWSELQEIHNKEKLYWRRNELLTTYVLRRNVDYILANCVIPVSETMAPIT